MQSSTPRWMPPSRGSMRRPSLEPSRRSALSEYTFPCGHGTPLADIIMTSLFFRGGDLVLQDRILDDEAVDIEDGRIRRVGPNLTPPPAAEVIDLQGGYLVPGYVDLHVHGGSGADFMDGTDQGFRTVCQAHARHGTTSILPTT